MGEHLLLSPAVETSQISAHDRSEFEHVVPVLQEEEEEEEEISLEPRLSDTTLSCSNAGSDIVECRICQEEDNVINLDIPCACSGSVKYAHRKCVQRWCNEKGDTTCEICHQPYGSGYTAPNPSLPPNSISIEISENWGIAGAHPIELRDPRILAMAAAQRHFLESEYNEYTTTHSNGAACCRSIALILMALLLVRHALAITATSSDEDASMFFTLFVLRVAGFLLPCYIMARAINMIQRRRQRQESAAEVAILLQAGQGGTFHFSLAPGSSRTDELP